MATFKKLLSGKVRAEVARKGVRKTKTCSGMREAKDWAAGVEHDILNAKAVASSVPFADVLDRYARTVTPRKRGARWETLRLEAMKKDKIAEISISELRQFDFADWRDRRLLKVAPATVHREMTLWSGVLNVAIDEWGLIEKSPIKGVRKPSKPPPRDRLASAEEMERLAHTAGADLERDTARAFHAFLFAIETAMRSGEILGLTWEHVDLDRRVAHLPMTKNGTARDVPLSTRAVELLKALPKREPIFDLEPALRDALWRKIRDRAAVKDLTFHDSRHMAITRLSSKLDVLALARMVGHRDLRMLQAYYNESAEDLAKRLD